MRHLVTGGMGFIGSALVRRLVSTGHTVRVLDDGSRGRRDRLATIGADIDLVDGDVRDPSVTARACAGVDCIWHLASVNGTASFYTQPELVLDTGVRGMLNVIDAAIRVNVPELFLASTSEVYQVPPRFPTPEDVPLSIPDPHNPRYSYAGAKIISELLALNYGRRHFRRVVIFRPHNVYGPDMGTEHVIPQLVLRMLAFAAQASVRVPIQGSGRETRAFVYIEDAIDALMHLLDGAEHLNIYHVGTEEEVTIEELAKAIGRVLGFDVQVISGPAPKGGTPRRCPDISRIRALGYRPRVALAEGLSLTIPWYRDHAATLTPLMPSGR